MADSEIVKAAIEVVDMLDQALTPDLFDWGQFTCSEAETWAWLARACGRDELAERIIAADAEGDEEGDEHYRGDQTWTFESKSSPGTTHATALHPDGTRTCTC